MKIDKLIGQTLDQINKEFLEDEIDLTSQTVRQKFTNRIIQECDSLDVDGYNVRSVKIGKSGKLSQHVKIYQFKYIDLVRETWDSSKLKSLIDKGFCIFLYTYNENSSASAVFEGILRFSFSSEEELVVKRVWLVTQNTVAKGEILKKINPVATNWIGQSRQLFVHVRPDAKNHLDTYALPVVEKLSGKREYEKHAFWINKKVIEDRLSSL